MTVRFSSNQVVDAGVQGMDNALADAMSWNQKITSGKQFSKVSDNAYAVSSGVRLDFDISRLDMFKANQNFVASSHANAQTQMDSLINEMNSLKQLFVQSQSGALNKSNFAALKVQAEQIRDTIKSQMTARDVLMESTSTDANALPVRAESPDKSRNQRGDVKDCTRSSMLNRAPRPWVRFSTDRSVMAASSPNHDVRRSSTNAIAMTNPIVAHCAILLLASF